MGLLLLLAGALSSSVLSEENPVGGNILPNGSFESLEPPPPTPETATKGAPSDQWLPRTWEVRRSGSAVYRISEEKEQAHSGSRAVHFQTTGGRATLGYGPLPALEEKPWNFKIWARGKGALVVSAWKFGNPNQNLHTQEFKLDAQWKELSLSFTTSAIQERWWLELSCENGSEAWLDDASLSNPSLRPISLPPKTALGKDKDTLLYLPCENLEEEKDGKITFMKMDGVNLVGVGRIEQMPDGQFGKCLGMWSGSSMIASASEYLNPACGTVEMWVRLRQPRCDGLSLNFVGITGPNGMYFGKSIWGQIRLGFSNGWQSLCGLEVYPNDATQWQPGVWRHFAACWDKEALQIFVDGQLVAWKGKPELAKYLNDSLCIGGSNWGPDRATFDFDDLRISNTVRYRIPFPPDQKNTSPGK